MARKLRVSLAEGDIVNSEKNNKYRIAGRSTMNHAYTVYMCSDFNNQKFRLKLYNGKTSMKGSNRETFLNLPDICGLQKPLDYGMAEGLPFDILPDEGMKLSLMPLPDSETVKTVIFQLADTIASLHDEGMLVRDLSKETIVVKETIGEVKIEDFDNIVVLNRDANATKRPVYNRNPENEPPEYEDIGDSKAGDYYALGKLLQYLLYGDADNRNSKLESARVKLDSGKSGYYSNREKLEQLMLGLLEINPEKRWNIRQINCFKQGAIYHPIEELAEEINNKNDISNSIKLIREYTYSLKIKEAKEFKDILDNDSLSDVGKQFRLTYLLTPSSNCLRWGDYSFSSLLELANRAYHDIQVLNQLSTMLREGQLSWWFGRVCLDRLDEQQRMQIYTWEKWEREIINKGCYRMIAQLAGSSNYRFKAGNQRFSSLGQMIILVFENDENINLCVKKVMNQEDFKAWAWINGIENQVNALSSIDDEDSFLFNTLCLAQFCAGNLEDRNKLKYVYLKKSSIAPLFWLQNHLGEYETANAEAFSIYESIKAFPLIMYDSVEEIGRYLPAEMGRYLEFAKKEQSGEIITARKENHFSKMERGIPVPEAYLWKVRI